MFPQTPQSYHASSFPLILLGAFICTCFTESTHAFQWPWQSQGPLIFNIAIDCPPSLSPSSIVLGIHLGATYASVAIYRNESVEMIPNKDGSHIIPNVVKFGDHKISVGEVLEVDPAHAIFGMERLIGRKFDDPAVQAAIDDLPFQVVDVDNKPRIEVQFDTKVLRFSPEDITAIVLRRLKKLADEYLETDVPYAVVTVPTDSNNAQRAAIEVAGKFAGLEVLRVIYEPVAAAIAYKLDRVTGLETVYDQSFGYDFNTARNNLVYNLGSRSFSASILSVEDGVFEIMSTVRNMNINSTSFDDNRFEDTMALVEKALLEENMTKSDIDNMVITGGSVEVAHMLETYFGKVPLRYIDPDEVATHGAAVKGYIVAQDTRAQGCIFGDVTRLTLGIETSGGMMYPLILSGRLIPTKRSQYFTTSVDDQTTVLIQVYEGVRPHTNFTNFLGEFELSGIPKAKKGIPRIEVAFEIDTDTKLRVTAKNMKNLITVDFLSQEGCLSYEDRAQLTEEAEKYYEDNQEVDLKNEIESYAYNNRTRNESTRMRLVVRDST